MLTGQDPLVLCVGARRYVVNPVYSQHVRGGGKGANNVHKSEKFLRAGGAVVATCFGPMTFGKSGVVLLKDEGEDQGMFISCQVQSHKYHIQPRLNDAQEVLAS